MQKGQRKPGPNQIIGLWGETQTCRYLERKGYRILDRNFRTRAGEIDIIAWQDSFREEENRPGTLVFFEVKTRRDFSYGVPSLAVNPVKQRHLLAASRYYAHIHGLDCAFMRYDVVELLQFQEKVYIRHIENAFN